MIFVQLNYVQYISLCLFETWEPVIKVLARKAKCQDYLGIYTHQFRKWNRTVATVPRDCITSLCYFIGGAEIETEITHYIHVYITLESTRKTDVGEYV